MSRNDIDDNDWTLLFVFLCAMNPLLVAFYREPGLSLPLYLSCLVFMIVPFGQLSQALLQKYLSFRSLAILQLLGALRNEQLCALSSDHPWRGYLCGTDADSAKGYPGRMNTLYTQESRGH